LGKLVWSSPKTQEMVIGGVFEVVVNGLLLRQALNKVIGSPYWVQ